MLNYGPYCLAQTLHGPDDAGMWALAGFKAYTLQFCKVCSKTRLNSSAHKAQDGKPLCGLKHGGTVKALYLEAYGKKT